MSPGLIVLAALAAPSAPPEERAVGASVSYVFASELGSGIYSLSGRTLQVYRIPISYEFVPFSEERRGVRAVLPLTVGFFDFEPLDIVESGVPSSIDSLSVTPGIELEYALRDRWRAVPYARFGATFASSSVDGLLYAAGLQLERTTTFDTWDQLFRSELALASVEFRDDVPDEHFARLRTGLELRRATSVKWGTRNAEVGVYGVLDLLLDPPVAPVAGAESETLQVEAGVMVGARPAWKMRRLPLPRLGLGYRLAGELSGWRFVIGAPF